MNNKWLQEKVQSTTDLSGQSLNMTYFRYKQMQTKLPLSLASKLCISNKIVKSKTFIKIKCNKGLLSLALIYIKTLNTRALASYSNCKKLDLCSYVSCEFHLHWSQKVQLSPNCATTGVKQHWYWSETTLKHLVSNSYLTCALASEAFSWHWVLYTPPSWHL